MGTTIPRRIRRPMVGEAYRCLEMVETSGFCWRRTFLCEAVALFPSIERMERHGVDSTRAAYPCTDGRRAAH